MGLPHPCKTGAAVLAFLQNSVLPHYSTQGKIYVIWDNFSSHRKALKLWPSKPNNVEFAWTPTNASWLNLIEPWFLALEKTALHNTDLKTTSAIAEHLLDGIEYLNEHAKPYRSSKKL